jgi:hypothetical protein
LEFSGTLVSQNFPNYVWKNGITFSCCYFHSHWITVIVTKVLITLNYILLKLSDGVNDTLMIWWAGDLHVWKQFWLLSEFCIRTFILRWWRILSFEILRCTVIGMIGYCNSRVLSWCLNLADSSQSPPQSCEGNWERHLHNWAVAASAER